MSNHTTLTDRERKELKERFMRDVRVDPGTLEGMSLYNAFLSGYIFATEQFILKLRLDSQMEEAE